MTKGTAVTTVPVNRAAAAVARATNGSFAQVTRPTTAEFRS